MSCHFFGTVEFSLSIRFTLTFFFLFFSAITPSAQASTPIPVVVVVYGVDRLIIDGTDGDVGDDEDEVEAYVNANEGVLNEGHWGNLLPDFLQLILIFLLFLLEVAEDVKLFHCLQVSRSTILHHFKAFLHDICEGGQPGIDQALTEPLQPQTRILRYGCTAPTVFLTGPNGRTIAFTSPGGSQESNLIHRDLTH
jgi:hypothetical protein